MYIVPLSGLEPIKSVSQAAEAQSGAVLTNVPFADSLANAMKNLEETQRVSQADARALALGQTDDLHSMQINSIKASTAVDMAAGATSRMLTAYNEIMRMQV